MSQNSEILKKNEEQFVDHPGTKWVTVAVFFVCCVVAFSTSLFLQTLSVWFELESKINSFQYISFLLSGAVGIASWFIIKNQNDWMKFLYETTEEMSKLAVPDKNLTFKMSLVVIVAVSIIGFFLSIFDWLARTILSWIISF